MEETKTILIVDDEEPIRQLIKYNLERDGFKTLQACNAMKALEKARSEKVDLIILDLMLPDMSGLDVCRILKNDAKTANIPIVMVTAKTEDADIVYGLEIGAEDYVTKPFSPRVLIARIKSVLRRAIQNAEDCEKVRNGLLREEISVHDIKIMPIIHKAYKNDRQLVLTASEFGLLQFMVEHPGQVFSRQKIISVLKGDDYPVTERAIDVLVLALRRKLDEAEGIPDLIETLRGIGYRLKDEETSLDND